MPDYHELVEMQHKSKKGILRAWLHLEIKSEKGHNVWESYREF